MGEEKGSSSKVPLLNGGNGGAGGQPSRRIVIGAVCGFLVVISFAGLIGFLNGNGGGGGHDEPLYCAGVEGRKLGRPPVVSRGVVAGVSEKSNRLLGGKTFPGWTNSMLSWQRTAFHFQPEKNWMNGIVTLSSLHTFF
ncbi:hypothetical protein PIB30_028671 [Stylosanthes scabra]|uniref:beta-fructofuranosidase n=1 Tax=Stylosanthes scabra TaxID=79078 RepID=A0ABU6SBV5_9FABA|nr:hypothetical protein [Stylosanthes scabra]